VVAQPFNRTCNLPRLGEVDEDAGEFWTENILLLPGQRHNLSAYERNRMYLNTAGTGFLDCTFTSGADIDSDSRSVIATDFNRDGAVDLLVGSVSGGPLRLFLNNVRTKNNSMRIDLIGVTSNRSAIGTRVVAECGSLRIVRDLFPANGFMGTGPAGLLLGVGTAQQIDRLSVRWPTGAEQVFEDIPANSQVTITEGSDHFDVVR
jgi:hypothetical protein